MLQSSPRNLHSSYFKTKFASLNRQLLPIMVSHVNPASILQIPPFIPSSSTLSTSQVPPSSHLHPSSQLPKSSHRPNPPPPHCFQLPESSLIAQTDNWGSCHIAIYTIILIKSACRCSQTAGRNSCSIISGDISNWSYRLFVSTVGPFSHLFGLAIFYRQKTTKNYPENRVFSWMNQRWRQLRLIASDPSERRQPERQQLWS